MLNSHICDSEIDAMMDSIRRLSSSQQGRIYALIELLAVIPEPVRPQSAKLLCEISQVIKHGGQSRFDIIDLMIDYLRLQSAAALETRSWPTTAAIEHALTGNRNAS